MQQLYPLPSRKMIEAHRQLVTLNNMQCTMIEMGDNFASISREIGLAALNAAKALVDFLSQLDLSDIEDDEDKQ